MNLKELQDNWQDTPEYHRDVHESFSYLVNTDTEMGIHRQWVRDNVFGFGEDSFHWLWKLIVDEMPKQFSFCEIGCFRFQIVSLIRLLANREAKSAERTCITPLSNAGGVWDSDYAKDAEVIHDKFHLVKDYKVLKGLSNEPDIIEAAKTLSPFDILYIDGGHLREDIDNDLHSYAPLVKQGGYLVIDDCANDLHMEFGYFQGIVDVTDGVIDYMKEHGEKWEFICSVVHIKVYKRK